MEKTEKIIDFAASLASTTHDMKNSLSMILSAIDEVVNTCTPEKCPSHKHLLQMQYEANRVNGNLIQLLTLYKMDNDQFSINISHYPVCELIEETIMHNRALLEYKEIEVFTECPDDFFWFFDRNLLSGVINNILNNAVKYAGDRVKIRAAENNGWLEISIEDNGNGYPDKMLRTGSQTSRGVSFRTGSTGLGHYFASIAAMMHKNKGREGYISISNSSEYGGGCFTITLP